MSQLQDVANEFRSRLLANETQAATRMIGAYARVQLKLEPEVMRLMTRIEEMQAKGETVGPGMAFRAGRLESLLNQAKGELTRFQGIATGTVTGAQDAAVKQSVGDTLNLTLAALGPAPAPAKELIRNRWDRLPTEVIEEFVGRTSAGGPLKELFNSLGARVASGLETSITAGLAAGYNPRQIAREVRRELGMGLNRALLISRTETITAYREATRRTYQQQPDIVGGWVWHSALGKRTCPACWAMHGTVHSNEERLDGHPNCRCSQIPITPSWEELGFTGLPDTRPQVPKGVDLFAEASPGTQMAVLGRKGYAAYQSGEVKLVDFLARTDSEKWGTTRYPRSLLAIRQGRGGFAVGEVAQGPDFNPVFPSFSAVPPQPVVPLEPVLQSGAMTGEQAADAIVKLQGDLLAEIQRLQAAEDVLVAQFDEARSAALKAGSSGNFDALPELRARMDELSKEVDAATARTMTARKDYRLRLAEFIRVEDPIKVGFRTVGPMLHTDTDIQIGLDTFSGLVSQATQPTVDRVTVFSLSSQRSFYRDFTNEMALEQRAGTRTVIHEMGHWLENADPRTRAAAQRFRDRRTQGEAVARMKDLLPGHNYTDDEVTTPDQFIHPYVGKRYADGATEVVSMGLENMWLDPIDFATRDRDHFAFIWDVVRGRYQ